MASGCLETSISNAPFFLYLQSPPSGLFFGRHLNLKKECIERWYVIESKQAADTETEEHDTGHSVKQGVAVDDEGEKTEHGCGDREQDRSEATDR